MNLNTIQKQTPQEVKWIPTLTTIGFSAFGGAIAGGVPGAVLGLTTSVADVYLRQEGCFQKHYLSSTAFWSGIVAYPFLSSLHYGSPISVGASLISGCVFSYFTEDFLDFEKKLTTPIESFTTLNRFFDEKEILSKKEVVKIYNTFLESPSKAFDLICEDIQEIYQNNFITTNFKSLSLTLVRIGLSSYFLYALASYANTIFIVNWIQENREALSSSGFSANSLLFRELFINLKSSCSALFWDGSYFLSLMIAKWVTEFAIEYKQMTWNTEICKEIFSQSTYKILAKDNGNKLLATESGKEIIQSMANDLQLLLQTGVYKINDVVNETSEVLLSFYHLVHMLPDAFAYYLTTLFPLQFFLNKLSNRAVEISKVYNKNQIKLWQMMGMIPWNIRRIKLRKAEEFLKQQYIKLYEKDKEMTKSTELIRKTLVKLNSLLTPINGFMDMCYLGFKFLSGAIELEQIPLFQVSLSHTTNFLTSNLRFQINSTDVKIAIDRLNTFFETIQEEPIYKTKRTTNNENKIILDNYTLFLKKEKLFHIPHLELEAKKRYALTGQSGCGKSSFLIDLAQGVLGTLSSQGEISIYEKENQKTEMMFLDQNLYLPINSTLLESVCFPRILNNLSDEEKILFRSKVLDLFDELTIDPVTDSFDQEKGLSSMLDSENFELSGGQRKKIGIIQAILQKPEILILDEIFTGLDKNSLSNCQKALNTYLPDSMILVVDHHVEDNNQKGFYDEEIHFSKEEVTISPLSLNPSNLKEEVASNLASELSLASAELDATQQ